jgi:hypothetical protein
MEKTLVNNWMTVALSILAVMYPMQFNKEVLALSNPVHAVLPFDSNTPVKAMTPMARRSVRPNALRASSRLYTYTFTGKATYEGQPLANASVEIRVTSEYAAEFHMVTTGRDGRYSLSVPVTGKPNEPLSWEIRGLTADLKQANTEGHQILTHEHEVEMITPLVFSEI